MAIEYWDSTQTAQVSSIPFNNVDPGTISAATQLRLVGVTADNLAPVVILRQEDGTGQAVLRGLQAINERWIQFRALGTGTSAQQETGWQPIGSSRWFQLAPILIGEYTVIEIRYAPPPAAPQGAINFLLDANPGPTVQALENGHSESFRDGILNGLDDGTWQELLLVGDVTESSPQADTVEVTDVVGRFVDEYAVDLAQQVQLDANDGSAVALASGEAYYGIVVSSPTGVQVVKGDKATQPLDPAVDSPTLADDQIAIARVERDFSGVIANADIVNLHVIGGANISSPSGLDISVGAFRAIVYNALIRIPSPTVLTLPDGSVSFIWIQSDGTISSTLTSAAKPEPNAYKIARVTTAGGVVTLIEDFRVFIGSELHMLKLQWAGSLADGTVADFIISNPFNRDLKLRPLKGSVLQIDNLGSVTAGEIRTELEKSSGGGAFASLFPSSATDDRRPGFDFNSVDGRDDSALPEDTLISSGDRLRGTIVEITPFTGTAPTGATLCLLCDLP